MVSYTNKIVIWCLRSENTLHILIYTRNNRHLSSISLPISNSGYTDSQQIAFETSHKPHISSDQKHGTHHRISPIIYSQPVTRFYVMRLRKALTKNDPLRHCTGNPKLELSYYCDFRQWSAIRIGASNDGRARAFRIICTSHNWRAS